MDKKYADLLNVNMEKVNLIEEKTLGYFIKVPETTINGRRFAGIDINNLKRWVALSRVSPYWLEPFFGSEVRSIPKETQYLLWERKDGYYGIMLPIIDGDLRATLVGEENGLELELEGLAPFDTMPEATIAFAAIGEDPYKLTNDAVKAVAEKLRSFKMREEKAQPDFLQYLGWCTWDAFYRDVDETKVLDGLQSFKEGGIQPGFMILDDGWLDCKEEALNSFRTDKEKFPQGLKGLIEEVKQKYNIKMFGVWHAFVGYWLGVHPDGELADEYNIIKKQAKPRCWMKYNENIGFIDPKDIHRFYHDFHSALYAEGVDMLKVDVQSSLESYTTGTHGRVSTMRRYQEALQGSCQFNFGANLINCMSNGSDVAYNMKSSVVWRNSDDFYPGAPEEAQQKHIYKNAMNNLWTSTFSLPDWDMFQSHHPQGEFHAAARAISGGPIYVCDKPHMQNFEIINKLCTQDGKALRCDRPALPAADCIFTDCMRESRLLKITNRCGNIGVLGLFHCSNHDGEIKDEFTAGLVNDVKGEIFAAYYNKSKKLEVIARDEVKDIAIDKLNYELITLSPIKNGFAPIGLLDKFNTAAIVKSFEELDNDALIIHLKDGGKTIGFYCEHAPKTVLVNDEKVSYKYNENSKLLSISAPCGNSLTVKVLI